MNLKGRIHIYKIVDGRVISAYKCNALTYSARNILADMLQSGSTPITYMVPLTVSESVAGDRTFVPVAGNLVEFYTTAAASVDVTGATQTVGAKTITITSTITPSPIDGTADGVSASLSYSVDIPFGTLTDGTEFNCIAMFDSTADPGSSIATARLFSFAVLPAPVTIGAFDNLVITYTYEIQ